jgi:HK97 family phage prohead protease
MTTTTLTSLTPTTLRDLFLDPARRDHEPRQGQIGHKHMTLKGVDEKTRQAHFLCSTGQVDRYGESVDPEALKAAIPDFMTNPVFVAGHVYSTPSGEPTVIGHWVKLWVSPDGLEGIAQFDDVDPLAQRYWNHFAKGNLRAVSVGFLTRGWEMREMKMADGQARRVRVFTDIDLVEISAVTIPANPAALIRAAGLGLAQDGGQGQDDTALQSAFETAFKRMFTSGSEVSFLRSLALEIVEVMRSCQASGGDGYLDGFPEDDDMPDASLVSQGQTSIKDLLREILPA